MVWSCVAGTRLEEEGGPPGGSNTWRSRLWRAGTHSGIWLAWVTSPSGCSSRPRFHRAPNCRLSSQTMQCFQCPAEQEEVGLQDMLVCAESFLTHDEVGHLL